MDIKNIILPYIMLQKANIIHGGLVALIGFVAICFVLEDRNEKCWTQIIPIYGSYVLCRAIWKTKYFWYSFVIVLLSIISFIIAIICGVSSAVSGTVNVTAYLACIISFVLFVVFIICYFAFYIMTIYNLSKTYDYDGGFTIGLIVLPIVFYCILTVKCIKNGVMNKISNGRKVFILVVSLLIIAGFAFYFMYVLNDQKIVENLQNAFKLGSNLGTTIQ